jgi:hypothetical protein
MGKEVLYRVGQAAKDLGVSSYRIRRLCETGLIAAEFSGHQWEIPASEIERLKRDGVPSAPKIVVDSEDAEPSRAPNAKAATALLADPSPEMIAAAEQAEMSGHQLTVAKNKLEQNKMRREQTEIEDYFADRQKRLQEQEAEENRRYEEELEADARTRHKEAADEKRQGFLSHWLEYALRKKPWDAPDEVRLDIHSELLTTLAKLDTSEREFVVQRLVDAAVERGLKTWKADEAKRAGIKDAVAQLPYVMRWYEPWKAQTHKIASEALKDVSSSVTQEEMTSLARTALQSLIDEFERAGKIQQAIDAVRVYGANYDELREGQELVREALSDLPNTASKRQITDAKEKALAPLSARVAERIAHQEAERQREEVQRRRERVLSSLSWRLPIGIPDDDRESAIDEINKVLNDLPADASERHMEKVRDEIVQDYQAAYKEKAKRAERKAEQARRKADLVQYGLGQIRPYAERLLREFDYERGETVWDVDSRVKSEVRKALEEGLTGTETEMEVGKLVRLTMRDIEGCG